MKKPVIGIVGNILSMEIDIIGSIGRAYTEDAYIKSVELAGGVPVVLPVIESESVMIRQLEICDGILFPGGRDIHPSYYGEEEKKLLGEVLTRSDDYQVALCKVAIEIGKPILAICRGFQMLNVACGGSLYQDLSYYSEKTLNHVQLCKPYEVAHKVEIKEKSRLYDLFGLEIMVNSYHHQSIKKIGDNLILAASAADGVVEAIEMNNGQFAIGVQWHPEMMMEKSDDMLPLFKVFIEESAKNTH